MYDRLQTLADLQNALDSRYPKPSVDMTNVRFRTKYESGVIGMGISDSNGNFLAIDCEGVECSYSIQMIEWIEPA